MPTVSVDVLAPEQPPTKAYQRISDFARYVELTDTVLEVKLHPPKADGSMSSEWTVRFRNGLLCWSEIDVFDPSALTIEFRQVSGDFVSFDGSWRVEPAGDGSRITFEARFDLGIPSLADMLDPVASSTLRANILLILSQLLGTIEPMEPVSAELVSAIDGTHDG